MLEETETEETIGFFCHIFIFGDILFGRVGPSAPFSSPLATPMRWAVLF